MSPDGVLKPSLLSLPLSGEDNYSLLAGPSPQRRSTSPGNACSEVAQLSHTQVHTLTGREVGSNNGTASE